MSLEAKIKGKLKFDAAVSDKGTRLVVIHKTVNGTDITADVWVPGQQLKWGPGSEVVAKGEIGGAVATDKDGNEKRRGDGSALVKLTIWASEVLCVTQTPWTERRGGAVVVHTGTVSRSAGAANVPQAEEKEDDLPF